jgi:hypothetical protein
MQLQKSEDSQLEIVHVKLKNVIIQNCLCDTDWQDGHKEGTDQQDGLQQVKPFYVLRDIRSVPNYVTRLCLVYLYLDKVESLNLGWK